MPGERYKHILLSGTGQAEPYKSRPGRGPTRNFPARQRALHGAKLQTELDTAWAAAQTRRAAPQVVGLGTPMGFYLEFRSEPGFELAFDSLDFRRSGIELRTVRSVDEITTATVFVPDDKRAYFLRRIERYLTATTPKGVPRNKTLIESISEIRLAVLESFWTDALEPFPAPQTALWWEVWLRREPDDPVTQLTELAPHLGLQVDDRRLEFPERTVVLVFGTAEQLSASSALLDTLAELRLARKTPAPVMQLSGAEQQELVAQLLTRIQPPPATAPAVCLLDTGITQGHPLLAPGLDINDLHTCDPAWGVHDHHSHGTKMAGLALYGDIAQILGGQEPVLLRTRLESVKLLPPSGDNPPELYGALTDEAVARAEAQAPDRHRIGCLTLSVETYRERGQPSSWSAAIDALSSGYRDDQRRLVLIAAGNTALDSRDQYPASNLTDSIHDPGQAWNALTVGAHTERANIADPALEGWRPLAPAGGISPSSSTSTTWLDSWPTKPDIVFEGGNMARSPDTTVIDYTDGLQLLTTHYHPVTRPFIVTGDTSAATAQAARLAALIYADYPNLWPETVRALCVHSSEWTPTMWQQFAPTATRKELNTLLRCCGFGVPSLDAALWSAGNTLTLLVQDELQPFEGGTMKDMHVHSLPWPKDVLESLGATPVELRVTLSYFVEPNPARRGWVRKFRYMSHGLRFDVKTPEESLDDFRKRLNRAAWAEEETHTPTSSDAGGWRLGPTLRHRGSIHSDRWQGTAVQLAARGFIGVYPVIGWWRERPHLGRSERKARYALVVTVKTPATDIDIYTPVLNQVAVVITR